MNSVGQFPVPSVTNDASVFVLSAVFQTGSEDGYMFQRLTQHEVSYVSVVFLCWTHSSVITEVKVHGLRHRWLLYFLR